VVSDACYLVSRSISTAINLHIPDEIWPGESVDYSTLWIFGYPVYSMADSQKINKLESKPKKCISIRFIKGVKDFRF